MPNPDSPNPEDRMTSQLNYLIVQHRHIELVCHADQTRLANELRPAGPASSPRWNIRRLLAPRQLQAARSATAASHARPGPPQKCLRCEP
jgi:hypothetical protein